MSFLEWSFLIASAAVDFGVAFLALFGPSRPIELGHLVRAALLTSLAFALKAVAGLWLTGSFFFVIHLAYVDVMLVLPLLGLTTLVISRRTRVSPVVGLAALLSLVAIPIGIWATFIEPFRLTLERTTVPLDSARAGRDELRVAVLADIQSSEVSAHLVEAVERTLAFDPHLILLPGDLIQVADPEQYEAAIPAFRELLAPLDAPLGVWFVIGNTDWAGRVRQVFEGTRVQVLENEWFVRELGDRRVVIGGAAMNFSAPTTRAFVRRLEALSPEDVAGEGDVRLLLAHFPDIAFELASDTRIDLVVAGHTHGGQVQLPLLGPPITLSGVPRRVAAGGLSDMDGRAVYVSRGLGYECGLAPRVRFLCPPELSLLTLVSE